MKIKILLLILFSCISLSFSKEYIYYLLKVIETTILVPTTHHHWLAKFLLVRDLHPILSPPHRAPPPFPSITITQSPYLHMTSTHAWSPLHHHCATVHIHCCALLCHNGIKFRHGYLIARNHDSVRLSGGETRFRCYVWGEKKLYNGIVIPLCWGAKTGARHNYDSIVHFVQRNHDFVERVFLE